MTRLKLRRKFIAAPESFSKRSAIAATILLSSAIYGIPAWAQKSPGWSASGRDFEAKCASPDIAANHACGEYLLGMLDGLVMGIPAETQIVCPPSTLSFFQLETAYLDWANNKAHPELLERTRGISAAAALVAAFPCPKP